MSSSSPSTRNLESLPEIETLRNRLKSLATLDAILCPDRESRYYRYDSRWSPNEELGSLQNGSGDNVFVHFTPAGCIIIGFDHESAMSPYRTSPPQLWENVLSTVPADFVGSTSEPAFSPNDTTFCIWRLFSDDNWHCGPIDFPAGSDPDGSEGLLSYLDGDLLTYFKYATEYFEKEPCAYSIGQILKAKPLTSKLMSRLNPDATLDQIMADANEIGYPLAT